MFLNTGFGTMPGIGTTAESFEAALFWGRQWLPLYVNAVILSSTTDAGNTPTTVLRAGLVMGQVTATKKWTVYSPTATDGSQVARGILPVSYRMTDVMSGTAVDRFGPMLVGGPVRVASLIGLDAAARAQLRERFVFDDDTIGLTSWHGQPLSQRNRATDLTLTASDAGTLFTTAGATGAVTFTLPALAPGLGPFWFLNLVDQNMTVAAAGSDKFIWTNSLNVGSLTFSTASQKIGGFLKVYANLPGTYWIAERGGSGGHTVTAA